MSPTGDALRSPSLANLIPWKAFHVPDNDIFYIQVPADDELQDALKGHAAFNHMLLGEVLVEAFEQFIEYLHVLQSDNKRVPFLQTRQDSRLLNIKLPKKLGNRAQALADKAKTPMRSFAYTALVHYAGDHNLIPSIGTVQSGPTKFSSEPSMIEMSRDARKKHDPRQKR